MKWLILSFKLWRIKFNRHLADLRDEHPRDPGQW